MYRSHFFISALQNIIKTTRGQLKMAYSKHLTFILTHLRYLKTFLKHALHISDFKHVLRKGMSQKY